MKKLFLLLLAGALLAGCAVIDNSKKEQTLERATMFYEKSIRWSDFTAARKLQHEQTGSQQAGVNLEKIKVTSYRQLKTQPLADENEVMITVTIDYYHDDAMKIHTLNDAQIWRYDPVANEWRITTPLPAFR